MKRLLGLLVMVFLVGCATLPSVQVGEGVVEIGRSYTYESPFDPVELYSMKSIYSESRGPIEMYVMKNNKSPQYIFVATYGGAVVIYMYKKDGVYHWFESFMDTPDAPLVFRKYVPLPDHKPLLDEFIIIYHNAIVKDKTHGVTG